MQVDYSNDFYPKIPFYMTYPMQSMYLTEMEYEKDMERMNRGLTSWNMREAASTMRNRTA